MIERGGCRRGAASRRVTAATQTKPACAGFIYTGDGHKLSFCHGSWNRVQRSIW